MDETREVRDPFNGKTVQINNDLVRRLRGQYAVGPTLPTGEPEFGWRQMGEPSAIQIEAADIIERARGLVSEQAEDEGLWFVAKTAPEAYLQQELRRLHAAIES